MEDYTVRHKSELELTGKQVITSRDIQHISMSRRDSPEGQPAYTEYSLESHYPLNREQLNVLLRLPINELGDDWQEVHRGLRHISYPSGIMRRLGKHAHIAGHLRDIRQPARQLADILQRNDPEETISANIPVFKYGQAQQYIFDNLKELDSRKLLHRMKGYGFSPELARQLAQLISIQDGSDLKSIEPSEDLLKNLALEQEIVNGVIIGESSDRAIIELLHYLQGEWFLGFQERGKYLDYKFTGGTRDYTAYLRNQDIPPGVSVDEAELLVGPRLRDDDRRTGLPRYRAQFMQSRDAIFARPLLVWRKDEQGRSFVLPSYAFDKPKLGPEGKTIGPSRRLSSIAGPAIAAAVLGKDIDYSGALDNLLKKANIDPGKVARAGLWPLVLKHQENDLLSLSYFRKVEEKLDNKVQ